jgi:hypothetical protein
MGIQAFLAVGVFDALYPTTLDAGYHSAFHVTLLTKGLGRAHLFFTPLASYLTVKGERMKQ